MKNLGRPNMPVAEVANGPQAPRCVEYGVVHAFGKWFDAWLGAPLTEDISNVNRQHDAGKCGNSGFTAQ
jgi:hypothetical protein